MLDLAWEPIFAGWKPAILKRGAARTVVSFAILAALHSAALAQTAGRIVSVQGTVEVANPDWAPARVDQELPAGAVVRTGDRSRAAILLADETQIRLGPRSQMELKAARPTSGLFARLATAAAAADQSIVKLDNGKAWVRARKKPAVVNVETPSVTAAIRGTEFVVEVADDGESAASVLEGVVDLSNAQGSVAVAAGEQGRARIGQAPTKVVLVNPDDAVQWSFYYSAALSPRDYPFSQTSREAAAKAVDSTPPGSVRRAEALFDAGRVEEALREATAIDSPEAAAVRGWALLASNRPGEAVQAFVEAGPSVSRARLGLSVAHYRLGEINQAFQALQPADTPALRLQQAALLLSTGDVAEVRRFIDGVPEGTGEYALAQSLQATILLTLNDKEAALEAARRAVQTAPESPAAHLSLSRVQQSFFDLPAATESALEAIRLDGQFLDARVQYAKLLFGAGRAGRAEEVVRGALADSPEQSAVHSLLGYVLLGQAKTDEAAVEFEKAVRLDSGNGEPRLGLGIVYLRQGKQTEAVAETLAAALLEPRVSLYQSYLAKGFFEMREFEQALAALDSAKELDPRDPTPHLYAGVFQNDLNRPGVAVDEFQESIRLNDNRAVYRSRFVLDEDRATRNVQLARAYNRLGLTDWGNREAILSNLSDPTSSSAHLFLANTFINLRGRTGAAGSESLVARLLLPVNANSFNSFNDYTTLYEQPRLNWTADGSYGSFDAAGASLVASGGTSRMAFSSLFRFGRTAGFRPQNDDTTSYTTFNIFKFALTPTSDLLVTYSHDQARFGDIGQVLVNDANDPDRRFFSGLHRGEVGYHKQFRPGSELLVYFSGRDFRLVDDNANAVSAPSLLRICRAFGRAIPPCSFQDLRNSLKNPSFTLQAAHLLKVSDFTFRYGIDLFDGKVRNRRTQHFIPNLFNPLDPELERFEQDPFFTRQTVRTRTAFVQTDYAVSPKVTVTGGLNFDWANDDNAFVGERDIVGVDDQGQAVFGVNRSMSQWNPHGAVLFEPFEATTVRFAVSRVLQPLVSALGGAFVRERLVPAHVNGFAFNINEPELSRSTVYDVALDQKLFRRSFLRLTGFWRDREIPFSSSDRLTGFLSPVEFEGNFYGAGAVWNTFFSEGLSFSARYDYSNAEDLSSTRREHEVEAALFYINHRGWFAEVRENYLKQTGLLGTTAMATKAFTTNAAISWEFPEKRGLVSFQASNLFDRRYEFLVDPLALERRIPRRQLEVLLRFNF